MNAIALPTSLKRRAVVFVTDAGFLMPTVSAACQVTCQASVTAVADVHVLIVDLADDVTRSLESEFGNRSITFHSLDSKLFMPPADTFFNRTHVSKTTLGRFALQKVLSEQYQHVLYIDGDVHIANDLAALVNHDVEPGFIAAGNEFLWLCEGDIGSFWRRHRAYLDTLGIANASDYFNAGVLAFRMDTWREMAPNALAYFLKHPERCVYHDQSALNAVFLGKREVLSPFYNFGTEFAKLGVPGDRARIIHFTGAEKPWYFSGAPWNGCFIEAYREFVQRHPSLKPFAQPPDAARLAAINKASRRSRWRSQILSPWRRGYRRQKFLDYLQTTAFAVR